MNDWPGRVVIVGAGGVVGSTAAFAVATRGAAQEIVLTDVRPGVARAHAIDITESLQLRGARGPTVVAAPLDEIGPADLVVLAAALPEAPSEDRRDFLARNYDVLGSLASDIDRVAGDTGVVLMVSNPVDVLCHLLCGLTRMEPRRIVGYSHNDSVRLRAAIARRLGTEVAGVDAAVLGEHGNGQVPIFSRVRVHGRPVTLDETDRAQVKTEIDGWFAHWMSLEPQRSSGWTTANGVVATIEAMSAGRLLPSCAASGGVLGLPDTFLTLPTVLGRTGVQAIEEWALAPVELDGLTSAARSIEHTARDLLRDEPPPVP